MGDETSMSIAAALGKFRHPLDVFILTVVALVRTSSEQKTDVITMLETAFRSNQAVVAHLHPGQYVLLMPGFTYTKAYTVAYVIDRKSIWLNVNTLWNAFPQILTSLMIYGTQKYPEYSRARFVSLSNRNARRR
jgi:hypothetical protein